jgi:drug/metabolite transporter (DMT)-like permease
VSAKVRAVPAVSLFQLSALLALTMVAFAANSVLNRMALAETATGPTAFAALRLASGAAMLATLVLRNGGGRRFTAGLRLPNAAALTAYMLGFSFAYVSLDAGFGALVLFGGVQITMFAGSVLAGEGVPLRRWIGAGIAFAGLVWLLWPKGAAAPPPTGAALMTLAAVGWGIYSLLGRGGQDPLATTAGAFALATVPGLAVFAVSPDALSPGGAALAVLSGAVTSGLGYALWYALLPRIAASVAAVLQLTVPVIAMGGGMAFLGEALTLRFTVAASLVLGGVALAVTAPSAPARRG